MRRTVLLVAAVVLTASLLPTGPPDAGGLPVDKLLHASAYAALAWLLARDTSLGVAVVAAAGFGLCVEGLQIAVPWRTASLLDGAANLAGAIVGATIRHRGRGGVTDRPGE